MTATEDDNSRANRIDRITADGQDDGSSGGHGRSVG